MCIEMINIETTYEDEITFDCALWHIFPRPVTNLKIEESQWKVAIICTKNILSYVLQYSDK